MQTKLWNRNFTLLIAATGLGAIGGIADSYMSRSKAKSMDAKLARGTKWVAAVFVVLTLVLDCMVAAGIK